MTVPIAVFSFLDPSRTPHPACHGSDTSRFGAYRAQWAVLEALGRRSDAVTLTIVSTPQGIEELRAGQGHWLNFPAAFVSYLDLPSLTPAADRTVIHHVGQAFDPAPYSLRRLLDIDVPVTCGHHSLGYPHLLDAARVLERQPNSPKDAILASSVHGQVVLERMIASVNPQWPGMMAVVPLPIDGRPPSQVERATARARLDLPRETTLVVSLGRLSLHDKASLEPLLWAISELKNAGDHDTRLLIAGDDRHGYSRELLRQAALYDIADRVTVHTNISDGKRIELLWAADLFVGLFDSHQEIFGLAVAEAQIAGLPCIVSDYSNIGVIVEDGVTGLTVPTSHLRADELEQTWREVLTWEEEHLLHAQLVAVDRTALLDALRTLVDNAGLRATLGAAAHRRARERFGLRPVVDRYAAVWEQCLTRARPTTGARVRMQQAWSASEVFANFATRSVRPGAARWTPCHSIAVDDLIDRKLCGLAGPATLRRTSDALRSVGQPMRTLELARSTGLSPSATLLALALLRKYGYVTFDAEEITDRDPRLRST